MATSSKKIAANRSNARKSAGPENTTSTRFNATKHGLLSAGITELDNVEGYRNYVSDLMRERNPVGAIETFLVESAAIEMVRWLRAKRLDAECITGELNPPTHSLGLGDLLIDGQVLDPGLPAAISAEAVQQLVTLQRYESTFANRFFRILHELERLQRMRRGEHLPAPVAVDVSVHPSTSSAPADLESSADAGIEKPASATIEQQKFRDVELIVHADTGTEDADPPATEELSALTENEGERSEPKE